MAAGVSLMWSTHGIHVGACVGGAGSKMVGIHSGRRILDQWLRLISQFGLGELDREALAVGSSLDRRDLLRGVSSSLMRTTQGRGVAAWLTGGARWSTTR